MKVKSIFFLFFLPLLWGNELKSNNRADPFSPYLTGKAPLVVREIREKIQDGIKIRELVFFSREYEGLYGKDSALIYAVIIRPEEPGNYPGLLVLHGGGGCAEVEKAKKWAALGYVVVALDEPGVANPEKIPYSKGPWEQYKYGENRFTVSPDITHSTIFDAVLSSLQGLYLLYEQPDVIKNKIGITGISWGGYLTSIVSGLANSMIAASFSVYGCGFYDKGSTFMKNLEKMAETDREIWLKYLDAGRRMNHVKTPFFIAAASNDNWFYPPAVSETLNASQGYTNFLFAANANHNAPVPGGTKDGDPQKPGWLKMEEIYFDYYLKGKGEKLPEITNVKYNIVKKQDSVFLHVRFKVKNPVPVSEAHMYFSRADVEWTKREWDEKKALLKRKNQYEILLLLKEEIDWFITISDIRPVTVSSHITTVK
jgi:dienelactone hydrolase